MDIVGTFNHLIPSDQLEDSLLLGQNLECEAGEELASGHSDPEDSFKNMLSDKDPMFGSACSQFLLEHEDPKFQLPESLVSEQDVGAGFQTGGDEAGSRVVRGRRKQTACRGRRSGRHPGPSRSTAREALLCRSFDARKVNPSMNPVVVLRRLTVTVGGFRIELLPGPCHTPSVTFNPGMLHPLSLQGGESNGMDPAAQSSEDMEEPSANGTALDFGPCVNPNDVQHTNGSGNEPKKQGVPNTSEKRHKPGVKRPKPATATIQNKPSKLLKSPDKKLPKEHAKGSKHWPPKTSESPAKPRKPPSDPAPSKSPQILKKPQSQVPEEDQEKIRPKKPEKILQRQRSRVSIEEPQLFVPDNAPAPKKEPEPPHEGAWDSSKRCGLCEKPHGNRFMVGCGRCDDWLHGDCVGLDLAKVRQMESDDQEYVCLKCCAHEDGKAAEAPGKNQDVTAGGIRPSRKDSAERRASTDLVTKPSAKISPAGSKKPSTGQIRRSVRDSLEEILLKRLKESDLKVSDERPAELARATEKEMFALFQGVDGKYKSKYRSLTFNLKDAKNNVLFKRVLRGGVSPRDLVRMSAEELASKELAAWRQRETRHTIEMIEKEQREGERRRPVTKITHKGEIEIEDPEAAKMLPEVTTDDPVPVLTEAPVEPQVPALRPQSPEKIKDTTGLHKSHLFDLHCKICTGRMAPPVEEASTKVVKVATSVTKRQSTVPEDGLAAAPRSPPIAPSALVDDLSLRAMEEGLLNFPVYESSSISKEDTAAFLASLDASWSGHVDMPAVARFQTRAYPVSGSLDHLSEDLPDTCQVGGRISPQIVWDYVEKIRASGTKEICVIRFTPDTEEDEISYTLLYAYFSSRRRYGVVANNRKQVKDMYLIPLGSAEKIPHEIVPFDGPGLESNRPNLLLGLIIRQQSKRDFGALLPSIVHEPPRFSLETKPSPDPLPQPPAPHDSKTDHVRDAKPAESEPPPEQDSEKNVSLRFLPGVLTKPDETTTTATRASVGDAAMTPKTPTTPRLGTFIIKKKESKVVKAETQDEKLNESQPVALCLKDKPGDVSTEAFLSRLRVRPAADSSSVALQGSDGASTSGRSEAINVKVMDTVQARVTQFVATETASGASLGATSTRPLETSEATSFTELPITEASPGTTVVTKLENPGETPAFQEATPKATTLTQFPIPGPTQKTSATKVATPGATSATQSTVSEATQGAVTTTQLATTEATPNPQSAGSEATQDTPSEFQAVKDIQNITTISSSIKNEALKQSRPCLLSPKIYTTSHSLPLPAVPSYHHLGAIPMPYPPQSNPVPFVPPHQSQAPPRFGYLPSQPPSHMMFTQNVPGISGRPWALPIPPPPQACFPQPVPEAPPPSYATTKDEDAWERKSYKKDDHERHRHRSHHHHHERDRCQSRSRSHSRSRHKSKHSKEEGHGEKKDRHQGSHYEERDRDKHRRETRDGQS